MPDSPEKPPKTVKFPIPPEPPDAQAMIDRYLDLADKALTPEQEHPANNKDDNGQRHSPPARKES